MQAVKAIDIYIKSGELFEVKGYFEEAIEVYCEVLSIDNSNQLVQSKINKLGGNCP